MLTLVTANLSNGIIEKFLVRESIGNIYHCLCRNHGIRYSDERIKVEWHGITFSNPLNLIRLSDHFCKLQEQGLL